MKTLVVALLLLVPLGALYPSDSVFVNDEPRFLGLAVELNRTGAWPSCGLMGSRGVPQGPLPIWVHAVLLRAWPDPEDVVLVRTLAARLLVAISVVVIALAVPALAAPAGAVALLAPYSWIFGRELWDMALMVPLAALAVAAYVSFCAAPRRWKIALAVAAAALALLTHLTAAALAGGLALHFAWFHRPWARRHPWTVLALAAAGAAATGPYLACVVGAASAAGRPAADSAGSVLHGLANAATGGMWFSTRGFEGYFGDAWPFRPFPAAVEWAAPALVTFTWLSLFLVWFGGLWSVNRILEARRRRRPLDTLDHAALVALFIVAAQAVVGAWTRSGPSYQVATWPAHFLLLWIGLGARRPRRPVPLAFRLSVLGWAAAVAVVTALTIRMVHRTGGNQLEFWGPSLRTQIAAVRTLARWNPASPVRYEVPNWIRYPHAPLALRYCLGIHGSPTGPRRRLVVRPASADPDVGWITVEEEGNRRRQ